MTRVLKIRSPVPLFVFNGIHYIRATGRVTIGLTRKPSFFRAATVRPHRCDRSGGLVKAGPDEDALSDSHNKTLLGRYHKRIDMYATHVL